jgi:hypothetical protein
MKTDLFEELCREFVFDPQDVRSIREKLGKSQSEVLHAGKNGDKV